jgi:SAM-dependent methyltransferase
VTFGAQYAGAYDDLYQDKNYSAECDLLERVFRDFSLIPIRRVLDLGCGTGRHAALLADRGYEMFGVDRSAAMLDNARARGTAARFAEGDITSFDLGETFDAVVVLFAVLGYLTENADVLAALNTARRHLRPGGILFADVWYGPAVLAQRPSERVKVLEGRDTRVIRAASGELDVRRNTCSVEYRLWRIQGERLCSETREQHTVRFFFEPELADFLDRAALDLQHVGAFPNIDDKPGEQTWNIAVIARAR